MPIDEVRQVLQAPDLAARNRSILVHLERMHEHLEQTQAVVASLQTLLTDSAPTSRRIDIRRIPATRAVITRANVSLESCAEWLEPALNDLHLSIEAAGPDVIGADGALYPDEFFETGAAVVTAFVPIAGEATDAIELPASSVADLDQADGTLGTLVAERGIGGPGPIREHHLSETTHSQTGPPATTPSCPASRRGA